MRGMGVRLHRGLTRDLALAALAACAACGGGGGGGGGNPPSTPHPDVAVTALVAADSTPLATIDPAAATDDDLAAFGAAVGERRIVLLTEATHGDGATFRLKTRLVRYLHERMGFDVLFVESGLYDVARIRQRLDAGGDAISVHAPGRIFYMVSRTDDGQSLLKYADATRATAAATRACSSCRRWRPRARTARRIRWWRIPERDRRARGRPRTMRGPRNGESFTRTHRGIDAKEEGVS